VAISGTTFDVEVIAAGEGKLVAFDDGAVVLRKDDVGDCAYIIKRGGIEICEGNRTIEILEPGEIFGEVALIDDEARTASAVAVGPVELIPIDKRTFDVLIRDDPDFAAIVMRLIARRLRAAMNMLEQLVDDPPMMRKSAKRLSQLSV
jgi:CRP-like cAMP-binding protein